MRNCTRKLKALAMHSSKYILTFTAGLLIAGIPILVALGSKVSHAEMRATMDLHLEPVEVRLKAMERAQEKIENSLDRQVELYTSMDKKQATLIEQVKLLVQLVKDRGGDNR